MTKYTRTLAMSRVHITNSSKACIPVFNTPPHKQFNFSNNIVQVGGEDKAGHIINTELFHIYLMKSDNF